MTKYADLIADIDASLDRAKALLTDPRTPESEYAGLASRLRSALARLDDAADECGALPDEDAEPGEAGEDAPHVVLFGDPGGGFAIAGPFPNVADAIAWAESEIDPGESWWAMPLTDPESEAE